MLVLVAQELLGVVGITLLGSWEPNVPYGPDGRMAAACLPDGVFPLLFPDGAPIATHVDFQFIWPTLAKIDPKFANQPKSPQDNPLKFRDVNFDLGFEWRHPTQQQDL